MNDADVPGVWRALGLPGLVDVHVHFLPEPVLHKVWAVFDDAEAHYGVPWPVAYKGDDATRVAQLQALGVRAYPALVYPHKPAMAEWLSRWAVDLPGVRPAACRPPPSIPSLACLTTSGGPWWPAPGSSRCTCRSAISTRGSRCWTRCGAC